MRSYAVRVMPMLSERLHRPSEVEGDTIPLPKDPSYTPHVHITNGEHVTEWSWSDAERRLKMAYEKDGFSGWAQAALEELEAERIAEKNKRDRL